MNCLGKTIKFGQEEWTILDWTAQGCLLISNRYADITAWDTSETHPSWSKSEIHDWLNSTYMEKNFLAEEQACIYAGNDDKWFWHNKEPGVFLLSSDEALSYKSSISLAPFAASCLNITDSYWWLRDDALEDNRCALLVRGSSLCDDSWPFEEDHKFSAHGIRPAIWLDFSLVEIFFPGWIKLSELLAYEIGDYSISMPVFKLLCSAEYNTNKDMVFKFIDQASVAVRQTFCMQLFELLWIFAERNDPEAINKIFSLCPDINRRGYWELDSPLRSAVEHNSTNAIGALIENGISVDDCSDENSISFALSVDASEDTIKALLSYGASVEYEDIFPVVVFDHNYELAKLMLSRSSCIHYGKGINGLLEAVEYDRSGQMHCFMCETDDFDRFAAFLKAYIAVN